MKRRVLVAPLDWGLGHATRCIPIIRALLAGGCDVLIAGSGGSLHLLQAEFPQLAAFAITGYRPYYPARGSMVLAMAVQLPRFMRAIWREHREVEALVQQHQVDLVIADNRYGCWTKAVPCIFITHQSNILMPAGFGWLAAPVQKLNAHFMRKFSVCWVPDDPGDGSLSGELLGFGRTLDHRLPFEFIGLLSRFAGGDAEPVYDVVAVCSGPEPQRAILETMLTQQLAHSGLSYLVVRGVPAAKQGSVVGRLTGADLEWVMKRARVIIARSGYSTLMDLAVLGKRAILIPTPGQTEQEYLARRLEGQGLFFSVAQHKFELAAGLAAAERYTGFAPRAENHRLLDRALARWVFETADKQ